MGIFDIFSGGATKKAANRGAADLRAASAGANTQIDIGYDEANNQTNRQTDLYSGLADSYRAGGQLYQDALGVNGGEGSNRATSAFRTSPGYAFNMDQGLQALARTRAVNGTLASGNADIDAMRFSQGLADQDWSDWLDRLGGLDTKRGAAVGAQAGTYRDLAKYAIGRASDKANLTMGTAKGVNDLSLTAAKAKDQGSSLALGALFGGANLLSGGLGGLAGNPNAIGNIGKNFSSAFGNFG